MFSNYKLGLQTARVPRVKGLVPFEVKNIKERSKQAKEWLEDFWWVSKQGEGFKSYYRQGLANVGDMIAPTFPSKDFVRILNEQEGQLLKSFSVDYATAGMVPANIMKMYPITPHPYAQTLYKYWYAALQEGEQKWGKGAFPQATKALIEANKALAGKATRFVSGYRILDAKDNVTFWRALERASIQMGSKDFAVTLEEKWKAFGEGAQEGLQNLAEGAGKLAEGAAGLGAKTLLAFFKGLGPYVLLGGGAFLGYKLLKK